MCLIQLNKNRSQKHARGWDDSVWQRDAYPSIRFVRSNRTASLNFPANTTIEQHHSINYQYAKPRLPRIYRKLRRIVEHFHSRRKQAISRNALCSTLAALRSIRSLTRGHAYDLFGINVVNDEELRHCARARLHKFNAQIARISLRACSAPMRMCLPYIFLDDEVFSVCHKQPHTLEQQCATLHTILYTLVSTLAPRHRSKICGGALDQVVATEV